MKIIHLLFISLIIIQKSAVGNSIFQNELEHRALDYYLQNSNPTTGLVRDEAFNFKPTPNSERFRRASIAATGFGLAVIANASVQKQVSREYAQWYATTVLRFVRDHVARRRGWFVHFIDWETGARIKDTEFSTIDTALFIAGALYAGQVFPGTEVGTIAHSLYDEMDFTDMLTDGGTKPGKLTLTMGYVDGRGYLPYQWENYAEHMVLLLLGLGSRTNPLPVEAWTAWKREGISLSPTQKLIGFDKPIFTHQYSQLFVDFRNFRDGYANYFQNGELATEFNRNVCLRDSRFKTFRSGFWGLSAGNSPDGYKAFNPGDYDGTVCPACAGASVMYSPGILSEMENWREGPYGSRIWGIYGFADSINLDRGWVAEQVYGITAGPLYLSLANLEDSTSVWKDFNQIPEIKLALQRAIRRVP